jgi:hypothetical protein
MLTPSSGEDVEVSNLKISLAMTPLADSFASWSSASLAA